MELIVDLHIHSHYARATSPDMNLISLYKWGKIKGISIIGTGDFTHPAWMRELQDKLEPAESGLYRLKDSLAKQADTKIPESCRGNVLRFVPTVEISNIYSKHGKLRKLHNIVVMPDLESAQKLNVELSKIGNLLADGRPILGLDSEELLKIVFSISKEALFIPAHIWTPWFGMFGSKSGFDSVEEAFGEHAKFVSAVETGLSSDPLMNWRVGNLDHCPIISNSDAHSPQKLGREATVLNCEVSYQAIADAIKTANEHFNGTIEFFPQEGKYHYDGHRACEFSCSPAETKKLHGICPVCGKPLTVGVDYRVEELASRFQKDTTPRKKVEYIIPLTELIAHTLHTKSTQAKKVMQLYEQLYTRFGDEFSILRSLPLEEVSKAGFVEVAEALAQMRAGKVQITPGFDGVYGTIALAKKDEQTSSQQLGLGI